MFSPSDCRSGRLFDALPSGHRTNPRLESAVATVRNVNAEERADAANLAIASVPFILRFYPGLFAGWLVSLALSQVLGESVAQFLGGTLWLVSIAGAAWFRIRAALAWMGARWRVNWIDDAVILGAAIAMAISR